MVVLQSTGHQPVLSRGVLRTLAGGAVVLVASCLLLWHASIKSSAPAFLSWQGKNQSQHIAPSREEHISRWQKPTGIKVIGLVFYGRRRFAEILQCYLHVSVKVWELPSGLICSQQNLVDNGGILDEVVFEAKTDDDEDLAYLATLLSTSPRFRAEYPEQRGMDFSGMYKPCVEGTVCVKIDDDVVS